MKKTFTHLRKGLMLIAAILIIGVDLAFAESIEGTKVYFEKPAAWSSPVNIYIYGDGDVNNSWPGEAMTPESESIYSFTLAPSYVNPRIIFNAAGVQAPLGEGFLPVNDGLYDTSGFIGIYGIEDTEPVKTLYFTKPAAWGSSIFAYVYDSDGVGGQNADWPGLEMESLGDDQYKYTIDCTGYTKAVVIFNDNGSNQIPASGEGGFLIIHNVWYTVKGLGSLMQPLNISSLTTSPESPQTLGSVISLSAVAENGKAPYLFKFSIILNGEETVLNDYQSGSTASWQPLVNGAYTVKVYVKDAANNVVDIMLPYSIDVASGIDMKDVNLSQAYSVGRDIYVQGEAGAEVAVFSVNGTVIAKFILTGELKPITVPGPGVYIVTVGKKTSKVIIK